MSARIQRRVFVSGRVQGVFFRESTVREAQSHADLGGFVRNLSDGRVEALFVGSEESVFAMLDWCKHGPPTASVTGLQVIEEDVTDPSTAFVRK